MEAAHSKPRRARLVLGGLAALLLLLGALVPGAQLFLANRLDASHIERHLEAVLAAETDSLYRVRIGSARFSWLGRSYVINNFELFPDTGAFVRRGSVRVVPRTRYRVSVATLRFDGIPRWPIFGRQFVAATAALDSLRIDISIDKTKEKNPKSVTRLPQQYLLEVGQPVRIGRLQISRGFLGYSERARDGARFGTLPFTNIEATVSNLSNRGPTGVTGVTSLVDVRALLAGKGPLVAHFEYDLASPRLNLVYHGSLSRMDVRSLNAMLVDHQGMRIRSGQIDTLSFKVNVKDDLAKGEMRVRYRDFKIETLDKVTRERSLGDVFRTFFANNFKLIRDNPSDDDPLRVAALRLARDDLPLFKFIWFTLRGGLYETVGLQEADDKR